MTTTDTDAPERIVIDPDYVPDHSQHFGTLVKYIRADLAKPRVKPLVWGPMRWDTDEYGCHVWGDFIQSLVSMDDTGTYAIYRLSSTEFMWTMGDDSNMRFSTYRDYTNPKWVAKIPWHPTEEAAQAAADAHHAANVLAQLEGE